MKRSEEVAKVSIDEIRGYPVKPLQHKPISKAVAERYGVRVSVNEETGKPDKVYFPYFKDDEVVAYKVKSPNAEKKKKYLWAGSPREATLFGLNAIKDKGKLLIITEGEDDCLAVSEMLSKMGKTYNVVSIPNGADQNGQIDKKVKEEVNRFRRFEEILLCLDMDGPGKATANSMAHWLAPMVKVKQVKLPRKDAGEMLMNGEHELFLDLLWSAKEYRPDDIISLEDIHLEELMKPLEKGFALPYPLLQKKLHGLRKKELTTLCAGTGLGKTTFAREIAYHLVSEHGLKIGNIFLEEGVEKTVKGYIAIDNNIPLPLLREEPGVLSIERWQESYAKFRGGSNLYFTDHFGSLESSELIDKCRYFAAACGVDFIFLDHISMVISGQESNDERKDIDRLMTSLAAFVNETGVGVLAIVHLKRSQNGSFTEGKTVSLSDLRGSSGIECMSWNVMAIEGDQQDEETKNQRTIRMLKGREWGDLGLCDTLLYNPDTGRMLPLNVEDY